MKFLRKLFNFTSSNKKQNINISIPLSKKDIDNIHLEIPKLTKNPVTPVPEKQLNKISDHDEKEFLKIPEKDREKIKNAILDQMKHSNNDDLHYIILYIDDKSMNHLNSLTRYFETNHFGLLMRSMWLMTILRDAQINGKEMAVVTIDPNSMKISDYLPIKA